MVKFIGLNIMCKDSTVFITIPLADQGYDFATNIRGEDASFLTKVNSTIRASDIPVVMRKDIPSQILEMLGEGVYIRKAKSIMEEIRTYAEPVSIKYLKPIEAGVDDCGSVFIRFETDSGKSHIHVDDSIYIISLVSVIEDYDISHIPIAIVLHNESESK